MNPRMTSRAVLCTLASSIDAAGTTQRVGRAGVAAGSNDPTVISKASAGLRSPQGAVSARAAGGATRRAPNTVSLPFFPKSTAVLMRMASTVRLQRRIALEQQRGCARHMRRRDRGAGARRVRCRPARARGRRPLVPRRPRSRLGWLGAGPLGSSTAVTARAAGSAPGKSGAAVGPSLPAAATIDSLSRAAFISFENSGSAAPAKLILTTCAPFVASQSRPLRSTNCLLVGG